MGTETRVKIEQEIMIHLQTNPKFKNHSCIFCGKDFARSGSLSEHIKNIHEGQRKYNCDPCGKSFTQSGSLKTHIKTLHVGNLSIIHKV